MVSDESTKDTSSSSVSVPSSLSSKPVSNVTPSVTGRMFIVASSF